MAKSETEETAIELLKRSEAWGDDADIQENVDILNEAFAGTLEVSLKNYRCVAMQMEEQGLAGVPYLDARTYGGWKDSGRTVRKGEHKLIQSITWIGGSEEDGGSSRRYPSATNLFHRSQTDAIEGFVPGAEPSESRKTGKRSAKGGTKRKPKGVTAGLAVQQPGVLVTINTARGSLEIRFSESISPRVQATLDQHGFRLSRAQGCWYCESSDESIQAVAYGIQNP